MRLSMSIVCMFRAGLRLPGEWLCRALLSVLRGKVDGSSIP